MKINTDINKRGFSLTRVSLLNPITLFNTRESKKITARRTVFLLKAVIPENIMRRKVLRITSFLVIIVVGDFYT